MPNIVICGTPGTGKSSLVEKLKPKLPNFNFIDMSKFAVKNDCISSYDEMLESQIIDERKLTDKLAPILKQNELNIIESIHADLLPDNLVDWVFVCRTSNTKLYDRLKRRGYNELKITNNVQAEIFRLISDEALDCFGDTILTELDSNEESDLERNVNTILEKIKEISQ